MRKVFVFIAISFVFLTCGYVAAKHFWRGETMSTQEVAKKWGKTSFEADKFKNGDESIKAAMAFSLIQNRKIFVGTDRSEIRKKLGDFDGFYFSDMFPAYMIHTGESREQDSWQIVFLLDRNEKVAEIIVHKNCCEK
jgi:hypothetical protein